MRIVLERNCCECAAGVSEYSVQACESYDLEFASGLCFLHGSGVSGMWLSDGGLQASVSPCGDCGLC
eukprot:m.1651836 g.1651836  ORF g.1651836 m.1651836 type:complete len:67 (+) comp91500_c0_seq1:252-452(+)